VEDAARAVAAGGFSVTGVKISKVGGIQPGLRINSVLPAYIASALDGPVGIAAGRRLAQEVDATRAADARLAHGLATQRLFASTIAATECELRGDLLHAAPGPGLGITIDEDSLRHHRL
ncbi:MAG TPA: enolase C-terminal domain-like protein, partial [Solirubrobacterales bacterium]|nr:enolase C-terminal domain-like protein [Solirubrobacterales bacterium]